MFEAIINETLVEKIFDTFDTDADLVFLYRYNKFEDIKKHLTKILRKFGLDLEFKQEEEVTSVGGLYQVEHRKIIVILPLKKMYILKILLIEFFMNTLTKLEKNHHLRLVNLIQQKKIIKTILKHQDLNGLWLLVNITCWHLLEILPNHMKNLLLRLL
jgi:hypothetical protein